MYRVLVVDDEEMIAEGIRYLVERKMPECQVIGLACDGADGYEKALRLQPDIILTDIRMPQMDGIEMIRSLKNQGLHSRYIILSGFSEFEYARGAISLGVEDYITKPIEEEELYATFAKVCQVIQKERDSRQRVVKLEEKVEGYSQNMKEYLLRELLDSSGRESPIDRLEQKEKLREAGFPVENSNYICVIWEANGGSEKNWESFYSMIEEKCRKFLSAYGWEPIAIGSGQIVIMITSNKKMDITSLKSTIIDIRRSSAEKMDDPVSAGVGLVHHDWTGIGKSFEEARCAINYKVIQGLNHTLFYDSIKDINSKTSQLEEDDIRKLESCMEHLDDAGVKRVVEEIFRKIGGNNSLSLEDLQMLSMSLILSGIRRMPLVQFQMNAYLGKNILTLESVAKFQTIEQLKNWIINILIGMNELMLQQDLPEKRDVIEEAKEFIARNFDKDVSLAAISEKFFINPFYFSQLFKKKTGETYHSYLTGLRIKRAKKLLEETNLKIYEVSELVGYADANHFSKLFERVEGMKPSEYKRQKTSK